MAKTKQNLFIKKEFDKLFSVKDWCKILLTQQILGKHFNNTIEPVFICFLFILKL